MTRLWLVRHGPTHAKSMVGWSDLLADLSDQAQIDRLSDYLPSNGVVISSDLQRAIATADAIQGQRRRLPHDRRLREIHFGDWELRTFAEIEAQTPEHIRAYWDEPGDVRPPNGESWHETAARVDAAVDSLVEQKHDDLIIVGHFGMILTQVQRALAITPYEAFSHRIDNFSVTEMVVTGADWSVDTINILP
ncbi:histidine phosphatase family protein [Parasulfitobacter algicola]|uniref:Histidine phosphatase family protein n=1 Tax=Parasulfitobacter algicola TaxID=2614809 RepID=A0ABX2IZG3_9RHOB|nr:histidine phosphatase family protein [Sulfitobacter algicola]NSX56136.1 histidine phosphatase family protein [Sulfitobacter algicola]